MKKLLLEILGLMLICMAVVLTFTWTMRLILDSCGLADGKAMYAVSLAGGFLGLIVFVILLDIFIVRRLKKLSKGLNEITEGNYEVKIEDKGIDEINTMTKDFNEMAKELKNNEFLNLDFVRNVSHELKTPLGNIAGYAQILKDGGISEEERQKFVDIIYNESMRTLSLSSYMLGLSRLNSSEKIQKKDTFSVDEQIREIILNLQDKWIKKNINFVVNLDTVEIVSNRNLTYHIFQNLISNAVKYTNEGGEISVNLHKNDNLEFIITNTGKGISKQDQQFIFKPFYVVDRTSKQKGTGLGLCITKKIVEALGGEISVESDENKDTTFRVILYCTQEKE